MPEGKLPQLRSVRPEWLLKPSYTTTREEDDMITQGIKRWLYKLFAWWPWKQTPETSYQQAVSNLNMSMAQETMARIVDGSLPQPGSITSVVVEQEKIPLQPLTQQAKTSPTSLWNKGRLSQQVNRFLKNTISQYMLLKTHQLIHKWPQHKNKNWPFCAILSRKDRLTKALKRGRHQNSIENAHKSYLQHKTWRQIKTRPPRGRWSTLFLYIRHMLYPSS